MERFMPKRTSQATERLAEALVLEQAREQPLAVCRSCGLAARVPDPVKCSVCGGEEFERLDPQAVERIIADEGGVEEETTYDGRRLRWTHEARTALRGAFTDAYQRRRAKARIEKSARIKKLDPITLHFAQDFIEEEGGVLYKAAATPPREVASGPVPDAGGRGEGPVPDASGPVPDADTRNLIARDAENVPLLSAFAWTPDAVTRVLRVPAGFMRDRTQTRIEELAGEKELTTIDLATVEDGIAHGLQMMAEMLAQRDTGKTNGEAAAEACPQDTQPPTRVERGEADGLPLNEVGRMREMERRRRELEADSQGV
jgi:hypothetical protein